MANRSEKRAAAEIERKEAEQELKDGTRTRLAAGVDMAQGEQMSDDLRLAMLAAQGGEPVPPLTVNEAGDLLAAAQLEIETLQAGRAKDRETILELIAGSIPIVDDPLLSRDVAPDELDLDPVDAEAHPGGAAYDAGLKAGMLRAALICETRWASDIGRHCAHSIREAEEKIT